MKRPILSTLTLIFLFPLLLNAQQKSGGTVEGGGESEMPKGIFALQFENGLSYYGRSSAVTSVSLQEYQAGPYIVTEMVVDLSGTTQLRIYYTELLNVKDAQERAPERAQGIIGRPVPQTVQARIDDGRGALSSVLGERVVKDYPTTTHAKTIEYRLASRNAVTSLYQTFVAGFLEDEREREDKSAEANDENEEAGDSNQGEGGDTNDQSGLGGSTMQAN